MSGLKDADDLDDIIQECEQLADTLPANSHRYHVNKRIADIARVVKEQSDSESEQ